MEDESLVLYEDEARDAVAAALYASVADKTPPPYSDGWRTCNEIWEEGDQTITVEALRRRLVRRTNIERFVVNRMCYYRIKPSG